MSVHEIGIERKQFIVTNEPTQEDTYLKRKIKENLRLNGFYSALSDWLEDVEKSGGTVMIRSQRHYAQLRETTIGVFHEDSNPVKNEGYLLSPREIWSRGLYRKEIKQ